MKDPLNNIEPGIEEAMRRIDRSQFVAPSLKAASEMDRPVPIGFGQTCSQPRLVAYMTQLLEVKEGSKVLEIGTGSGFQTALLLELGCVVYSIEIIRDLAESAEERLLRLGYKNFKIKVEDGSLGWHEESPFDACIFTCATKRFPKEIITQMKIGARAVYPHEVGSMTQNLMLGKKNESGEMETQFTTNVLFVPLLHENDI